MRKLAAAKKYIVTFGLINTVVLILYKLKPRYFSVLAMRFSQPGLGNTEGVNYKYLMDGVFGYKPWDELGGGSTPMRRQDENKKVFIWFVPDWTNVWGGGHYTLFRFANHFAGHNTENIIFIYNNERHSTPEHLQNELDNALTGCKIKVIVDPKMLPECDGAIATTWQSAYSVRAFPFAKNKFYFMQDYESLFYAHGTSAMQANATYGFGFHGITGGGWLKKCYESHGGRAVNYRFAADRTIFYPADKMGVVRDKVKKIFFYGRPSTERRCFELGIVALKKISEKFPDIEIVIAGLDLKSVPPFKATLLGNLSLAATGDLYRTCDIGIAFSGTNLSYLPIELMSCGVPVVSNNGAHVEWHCTHLQNSFLCDPVPEAILDGVTELIE